MILKYSAEREGEICRKAVNVLKDGGLIVYPTDTVYGIGADATNSEAVEKVYLLKKRPREMPLSVLVSCINMAKKYVELTKKAKELLPGKYTFILKSKRHLPVSKGAIGIRLPNHWCTKIPELLGKPITTTSANIHGKDTPQTIKEIQNIFRHKIKLYIDEGVLSGPPSIIYSLEGKRIR